MDEDIDKTGYTKLKTQAFYKAIKYCSEVGDVTIGPDASPSSTIEEIVTNAPTKPLQRHSHHDQDETEYSAIEKEREEERYCTKKILAELNKFCALDGQKMKLTKIKKRLEYAELAKQEADRLKSREMTDALRRRQEMQEQIDSIHNELLLKQQQLASSFISIDITNKKMQEIKKQSEEKRLLKEKANEKKRIYYDSIYKNEREFTKAYSEIVDIILNSKELKQAIASEVDLASKINGKFISFIDHCKNFNIAEITAEDVELSFSLLKEILEINLKIKLEKEKFEAELKQKKEEEELAKKTLPIEIDKNKDVETIDKTDERDLPKSNYIEKYNLINANLIDVENRLKPFITDESFKKYRSDCQKAVNLPVNAISPCSAAHLTDKLKKLTTLLSGQYVNVSDKRVSAGTHPLGLIYCTNLLAEKIVKQGEQVVSSKPDAAFAIAAVTVAIWMEYPEFGKLLLAHFYRRCPYLIPAYWEREENQTEEEYYKKLGFTYCDGEREEFNMFLKRQGGIVRLFSSIIASEKKMSLRSQKHPLSLAEGWKLLAAFIKLEPKAEISATILLNILEVVGDAMVKTYGIQFHKLLHVICKSYLSRIMDVTAEGKNGGPLCRLRNFLESIAKGKALQPPKGLLPSNFW